MILVISLSEIPNSLPSFFIFVKSLSVNSDVLPTILLSSLEIAEAVNSLLSSHTISTIVSSRSISQYTLLI